MESSVVLIHGAFAGPWSMENFTTFLQGLGWTCHAPALRFHDAEPEAVPDPDLAGTSIEDYTDDIAAFVQELDAPPILVGHSMGGVIAQKLAARGLARAVVLLNGSVNWGILPSTDDERAVGTGLMASGPFWETTLRVDFGMMADFALNRLDPVDQRATFARLVAESGRAIFELFFWMFDDRHTTRIDYERVKCPVLVVSGSDDRGVSGHTARQIATRHGANATFFEATGFGHYLMLEPGWQAVATRCADWMSAACERSG